MVLAHIDSSPTRSRVTRNLTRTGTILKHRYTCRQLRPPESSSGRSFSCNGKRVINSRMMLLMSVDSLHLKYKTINTVVMHFETEGVVFVFCDLFTNKIKIFYFEER